MIDSKKSSTSCLPQTKGLWKSGIPRSFSDISDSCLRVFFSGSSRRYMNDPQPQDLLFKLPLRLSRQDNVSSRIADGGTVYGCLWQTSDYGQRSQRVLA